MPCSGHVPRLAGAGDMRLPRAAGDRLIGDERAQERRAIRAAAALIILPEKLGDTIGWVGGIGREMVEEELGEILQGDAMIAPYFFVEGVGEGEEVSER